jgi:hypothetical protein
MKKLMVIAGLVIMSLSTQAQKNEVRFYLFTLGVDTMVVTKADNVSVVVVATPSWSTDSTVVSGDSFVSHDGHTTSPWILAPDENVTLTGKTNTKIHLLTIISRYKTRVLLMPIE